MPTPTPAALKAYAQDLRELATTQRGHAASCEAALDAVTKLDTTETWAGSYPDTAHREFAGWVTGLKTSADRMRAEATTWDRLADQYDEQAGSAGSAAKAGST